MPAKLKCERSIGRDNKENSNFGIFLFFSIADFFKFGKKKISKSYLHFKKKRFFIAFFLSINIRTNWDMGVESEESERTEIETLNDFFSRNGKMASPWLLGH